MVIPLSQRTNELFISMLNVPNEPRLKVLKKIVL